VIEQGYSCSEAGRSLGINGAMISRWKRELSEEADAAFRGNGKRNPEQQRIYELETENRRLRMERDILKKSHGLLCQGKSMRYRFIDTHKKAWPVRLMCGVLNVSASGYHDWAIRTPSQRDQVNGALNQRIEAFFAHHRQRYGAPRLADALRDEGYGCSDNRVAR